MKTFKCLDCGRIFDSPKVVEESRGEFWGMPCTETMYYCPYCGGDIDYVELLEEELERNN